MDQVQDLSVVDSGKFDPAQRLLARSIKASAVVSFSGSSVRSRCIWYVEDSSLSFKPLCSGSGEVPRDEASDKKSDRSRIIHSSLSGPLKQSGESSASIGD